MPQSEFLVSCWTPSGAWEEDAQDAPGWAEDVAFRTAHRVRTAAAILALLATIPEPA